MEISICGSAEFVEGTFRADDGYPEVIPGQKSASGKLEAPSRLVDFHRMTGPPQTNSALS
jgi:hypothetical protein